jgi:quinol monooxygenase YgiN
MKEPIILNAHLQASVGRETELGNALRSLVAPSRLEPGCLAYELHHDIERPGSFMFYEKFADQGALDAHLATDHFKAFQSYLSANDGLIATQAVTRWQSF